MAHVKNCPKINIYDDCVLCYRFVSVLVGPIRSGLICTILLVIYGLSACVAFIICRLLFESSEKFRYNRQSLARFISILLFTFNSSSGCSQAHKWQNRVANLLNKTVHVTMATTMTVTETPSSLPSKVTATQCSARLAIVKMHEPAHEWLTMDSYFCCTYKSTSVVGANQMK